MTTTEIIKVVDLVEKEAHEYSIKNLGEDSPHFVIGYLKGRLMTALSSGTIDFDRYLDAPAPALPSDLATNAGPGVHPIFDDILNQVKP